MNRINKYYIWITNCEIFYSLTNIFKSSTKIFTPMTK